MLVCERFACALDRQCKLFVCVVKVRGIAQFPLAQRNHHFPFEQRFEYLLCINARRQLDGYNPCALLWFLRCSQRKSINVLQSLDKQLCEGEDAAFDVVEANVEQKLQGCR